MPRTTAAAVKGLLGENYNGRASLDGFIATAHLMTNKVKTYADGLTPPHATTDEGLELVERYLAAGYYQKMDKGFASRSTEGASGSFEGQTRMYLEANFYLQTAVELDDSGYLAMIAKGQKPKAAALWLGTPAGSQADYEDRR